MASTKIVVDGHEYPSKAYAKRFFMEAIFACEGSEQSRMSYALSCILSGCTYIDTYNEISR